MDVLSLDTNAFIWAIDDPSLLSSRAREAIVDESNELVVSAVVGWEIAIKTRIGKLDRGELLVANYMSLVERLGATHQPILASDTIADASLGWRHRDPFDRLLVSQALLRGHVIVTADIALRTGPASTLW